jgi:hypothetical protein
MKRITAVVFLLAVTITAGAQQPTTKQAHADAIKMPAEYATKIADVVKASREYAEANAKLVSAWKDYVAQQNAFQNEIERLITRAAIAAHLTLEQLDNSDLKLDEKGNYEWVPKVKPEKLEPVKPKQ